MTEAPEDLSFSEMRKALKGMLTMGHAAWAIYMSQLVENILADELTSKMAIPSNTFKARIFEGYGPLSSFNAKIDIARALEIVDDETYNTLRILKSIRNEFAHPKSMPNFDDAAIVKECRKLPGYADDENCFSLFSDVVASIIVRIDDSEDAKGLAEELRGIGAAQKAFAKKSP